MPCKLRPRRWIPSEKAILGNVGLVEGMHVWMADTQTDEEVTAWLDQLKEIQALKPERVIIA
ncbi:hypothetical protein [Grimontia hollisae]